MARRRPTTASPRSMTLSNLLDGYFTDGPTRFKSNSYAAFGEANWHVTDSSSTGGLRYTSENKDYSATTVSSAAAWRPPTPLWSTPLPILRRSPTAPATTAAWPAGQRLSNVTDNACCVYARYARGDRSGASTCRGPAAGRPQQSGPGQGGHPAGEEHHRRSRSEDPAVRQPSVLEHRRSATPRCATSRPPWSTPGRLPARLSGQHRAGSWPCTSTPTLASMRAPPSIAVL